MLHVFRAFSRFSTAMCAGALLLAGSGSRAAAAEATAEQLEFFEAKIVDPGTLAAQVVAALHGGRR